jgi:hypothetical protein
MSVAIDKAGENDSAIAVEFRELAFVVLHPGMTQNVTLTTDRDDLSSTAEHCGVFDDANVIERGTATRPSIASQGEELADVGKEKVGRGFRSRINCHRGFLQPSGLFAEVRVR